MAKHWYYFDLKGNKKGPVSSKELKALAGAGDINPSTKILTGDGSKLVEAGKIDGLFAPSDNNIVPVSSGSFAQPVFMNGDEMSITIPVDVKAFAGMYYVRLTLPKAHLTGTPGR